MGENMEKGGMACGGDWEVEMDGFLVNYLSIRR